MFKYYNPHPKGITTEVGDCVKRAIVVTTGIPYIKVQNELNKYKKITGARSFNTDFNLNTKAIKTRITPVLHKWKGNESNPSRIG